jgi:hypothetical protein
MKVYDLEGNTVLDIVMKPHRRNLDLKYNDECLYVADQTSKSVIVSSVKEGLLNYDKSVKISKTVSSIGPAKNSFYQKSSSKNESSYGGSSQSTANFGRKLSRSRQMSTNRKKNSILSK